MQSHESLLTRITGEFHEMPGLRITLRQASRLWHLDQPTCESLLNTLVENRVLFRTPHGSYGAWPARRRPVLAVTTDHAACARV